MASELEQQLGQLDELLGLLDASALRSAQEALEYQIAELSERLEVTRQALAQAQPTQGIVALDIVNFERSMRAKWRGSARCIRRHRRGQMARRG